MAIVTIEKDRFNEFFERSIIKFFNDSTVLNSQGETFNQIYIAKYNSDDISYHSILETKKGIIVLEKSLTQKEEKYIGGSFRRELIESGAGILDSNVQISDNVFEFSSIVLNIGDMVKVGTEYKRIKSISGSTASIYGYFNKDQNSNSPVVVISNEIEARGFIYYADLQLRVITNTNQREGSTQKEGGKDLIEAQSFLMEIFKNQSIPFYDFENDIPTSMNVKFKFDMINYVEIPISYEDNQEGVFTIPVWCDIYENENNDIIFEHVIVLDKRT